MRKVKSFSIDDVEDIDIIEKLNSCSNVSEYIKNLIRNDLNKNHNEFTDSQIEAIKKIVSKMLDGKVIAAPDEADEEIDELDKAAKELLNNPAAMNALLQYNN